MTQFQSIFKQRFELLEAYESKGNFARKRLCYCTDLDNVEELTWHWLKVDQRAKNGQGVRYIAQEAKIQSLCNNV